MNRLSTEQRARIIGCLVEGMSIRATVRVTGAAKNTVTKLLCDLGSACSAYQDATLVGLDSKRIECDEIWSFCYAKQKNVPEEHKDTFGYGDVWTWTAIDADSKLAVSWMVGERTSWDGYTFMTDVARRLNNRVQIDTDGLKIYMQAVGNAFGGDVDHAMIHKLYGDPANQQDQRRYSPAVCTGIEKKVAAGNPDLGKASTSYVERQNLTMRMGMRRFTRLTNGFSKKIDNLICAVSLHFMYYNFARPHQTLTKANGGKLTTPAMAAGKADRVWTLADVAGLLD